MKIMLCCDMLMTSEHEQVSNLKWIKDLIFDVCNYKEEETIIFNNFNNKKFERNIFFFKSNIKVNNDTQFFFNENEISNDSLEYLKKFIPDNCIVIGYELSYQTRFILDKIDIIYIDIWLGPIRFLDDITFALRSNNDFINNRIQSYEIDEEIIKIQARLIKIQNYRGFLRSIHYYNENSAVFVGQVCVDKALLCNGKMLSLLDFKEKFENIISKHSQVYYCRHPFIKDEDKDIIQYIKGFKNVKIGNDISTYHMISNDEISGVYGISSSLLSEAKFFDKYIEYFYKPVVDINYNNVNRYFLVSQCILHRSFWKNIIYDLKNNLIITPFFMGKDKIRDALSFYWGYRKIDKIEYIRNMASK